MTRLTAVPVNGKTTEFIWQGHKLIAEADNDKHWQSYFYEPDSYRSLALEHYYKPPQEYIDSVMALDLTLKIFLNLLKNRIKSTQPSIVLRL